MIAPLLLALFALLAAALAPRLLRSAAWVERSPGVGILLWQALSGSVLLATVLAGAALALPAVPLTTNLAELLSACGEALRAQYSTPAGAAASAGGTLVVLAVVGRAVSCLSAGLLQARRQRGRQLQALALVARADHRSGALVVDHPAAVAYCLPGPRGHVVLTTAALAALDTDEVAAVLAHERAHLRARHHLVVAMSAALQRAFPRIPVFRDAHCELARLVEMHADDAAAQRSERMTIATALVRLAESPAPAPSLGAGGSTSLARVRRLVAPAQPLTAPGRALGVVAAVVLVTAPVGIVTAPAVAAATTQLCPVDFPAQPR